MKIVKVLFSYSEDLVNEFRSEGRQIRSIVKSAAFVRIRYPRSLELVYGMVEPLGSDLMRSGKSNVLAAMHRRFFFRLIEIVGVVNSTNGSIGIEILSVQAVPLSNLQFLGSWM